MHLFFILSSPFLQPLLTIDNCSLLSTFLGLSHLMCLPPHPANIPSALWHQPLISFMVQYVPKHLSKLLLHSALTYGSARPHRYQELSTRKKEGCPSNLLSATHSLQRVINGARFCKESCLKLKKTHSNHHHQKAPNKWADKVDQQTATTTSLLEKFPTASHIQPSSSHGRVSCASRCSAQLLMRTNAFTDDLTTEQSHGHPAFCMPLAGEISPPAGEETIFCWESDRPGFTSNHYTRFLGLGVSSVEKEFRELISNPDDPPIYLRSSFRILAQTGTRLQVKNILRMSQCFWEPQIFAKHTQSTHKDPCWP